MHTVRYKRIYSFEEVTHILMSVRKPGVTIASVCAKYDIPLGQFVRWYRQFEQLASGMSRRIEYLENVVQEFENERAGREQEPLQMREVMSSKVPYQVVDSGQ